MTSKDAQNLRDNPGIEISHTPRNQNTIIEGVIDGKAFYEALSMGGALKYEQI